MQRYILNLKCRNQPGIVAKVSGALFEQGGDISEAHQFDDPLSNNFYMRVTFKSPNRQEAIEGRLNKVDVGPGLNWSLYLADARPRILIMVSKFDHCLVDLVYRSRIGDLDAEIVAVAGNHPSNELRFEPRPNMPYIHLPVTTKTKQTQEKKLLELVKSTGAELIVLARYMQILSQELTDALSGRCINIHHSFLPGFKGAKPYHQAYERGVKMIGATAHYVTSDLDEGPIIAQDVETISHADTPDDLVAKGRDIERRVLARAVQLHLERRILLDGTKTIVFQK
ncbi:formyltetrahydrofolate deformylase [Phyllobacterium sp. YR531]|uniref:formyltetrahydrofolate deformylase n=1 Tax=Phyllobacterium sp. YR531 TaxID=1144343 RepID=UPI00026FCB9A|nr:formyltetrahydrofolate deformylase [Phyllobacterium sp. YR531]EJN06828.1 formyltetrahydrofolate deformylase [Phyllobacterium sp. YR531]